MSGLVISIASGKGGVGKTTTALSFGSLLFESGKKVLLVDGDPNNNATGSSIHPDDLSGITSCNILHVATEGEPISAAVCRSVFGFDLLPSTKSLASLEKNLADGDQTPLYNFREKLRETDYDYIVIDCPPRNAGLSLKFLLWPSDISISTIPLKKWESDGAQDIAEILHSEGWPKWIETRPIHLCLITMAGAGEAEQGLRTLIQSDSSFLRTFIPRKKTYESFQEGRLPSRSALEVYAEVLKEVNQIVFENNKGRHKKIRAS